MCLDNVYTFFKAREWIYVGECIETGYCKGNANMRNLCYSLSLFMKFRPIGIHPANAEANSHFSERINRLT